MAPTCHLSYIGNINRRVSVQAYLGKMPHPFSKITKAKRAEVMA
jgi:hypothetical protein